MRIFLFPAALTLLILSGCSPQDQEKARQDTHRAEEKIREGAKDAGREIKKDLRTADQQLKDSMEKGRHAAQHAGRELRKELSDDDAADDRHR